MSIDKLINLGVTLTLIEMMVAIGLGVTFAQVVGVARNGRLIAKAIIANYVLVPVAAVALLMLFHPPPMVAAGFLLAAVCPGAPYGPPFTAMAKGNVPMAVGLMVILAGSSAIIAPLLLSILLPLVVGSNDLRVDTVKIVSTLMICQLIPLCIGLFLRQRRPGLAQRLKKPAARLGTLLNVVVFTVILVVQFHLLRHIHVTGFVGMLLLVVAFYAAGWLLGGPGANNRRAMALSTGVRNVGVSLVIATGSFPGTPAVTAALVFAIFQTIVLALAAAAWGRLSHDDTGAVQKLAA
jgi:bile acid:Na+ symporter, BASS family